MTCWNDILRKWGGEVLVFRGDYVFIFLAEKVEW